MPQAHPLSNEPVLLIKQGLDKIIQDQAWAASFISQWSLSRLIKPSVEYAKVLNLDFKSACNLWLNCTGTRILLDLCGFCFNKFDEVEMKRFIYDLENVFADNRPNFDWCIAQLSSLFPLKFISNILRMPSMLTPNFIHSTVTVLEYLSNASEKSLKNLLKEIIDEALDGDDLKSKDYIPNLIQLSSKSETYSQAILNVFLDYMEQNSNQFIEKLHLQVRTRPLDYNPERLQIILPELILRTKENGTRLLLMVTERFGSNPWCMELVEVVLTELESMVWSQKSCTLFDDIRKESTWPILWHGCMSNNKTLQQTALRLILVASNDKHSVLLFKTIEELITKNTITHPWIFDALVRLLDGPYGIVDAPNISIPISHIIQRLTIETNQHTHQNQSFFALRNLVELLIVEQKGQSPFLKRSVVTSSLQNSLRMIINIWEVLLRRVMPDVENVVISNKKGKTQVKEEGILKKIKIEKDDAMEIADLEEENVVYGTKEQIHMVTNLLDMLEVSENVNMSDAMHLEKFTVKYFFWCLTETDEITRLSSMSRCFSLLTKQCSENKCVRSSALRNLLEGALFIYGNLLGAPRHVEEKSSAHIFHTKDESLLKLNQRQGISLNASRSSILHSGVIGSGIPKVSQPWMPDTLDSDIKMLFIKAIVSCCEDINEAGEVNLMDGLCYLSQIVVELISTDVMYNGLLWPIEDDFIKITMERDLHIRRTFKNCPILWSLLGLFAQYRMPLWCNCSVVLRALCASVMHHWRAKSTETMMGNNEELLFFTVKLLEVLALSQLLPPPLSYLHIIVPSLDPQEISYVLKECVWNYFVANGATFFTTDEFAKQIELTADPQFVDPLRNTMQKKLNTLGDLYYQMFILPEQQKS
jgi:integrator complex subunit 5